MTSKFNSNFEFSQMYSRENNNEDYKSGWQLFPLGNATEIIELDPEDIILPVADDPIDFIIEFGNECEYLQYIAEKTNELYGTTYTEEDVNTIINEFIESVTE